MRSIEALNISLSTLRGFDRMQEQRGGRVHDEYFDEDRIRFARKAVSREGRVGWGTSAHGRHGGFKELESSSHLGVEAPEFA